MNRILSGIDLLGERVGRLAFVFLPIMVGVLFFEVVARYFFNAPTVWAYDAALMSYAWAGFLGGALVQRRNGHIRVDILTSRLSRRGRALLDLASLPLALFFLALVVWQCGIAALDAFASGARRPTDWAPPLVMFILPAAIGAALLMLQFTATGIRAVLELSRRGVPE